MGYSSIPIPMFSFLNRWNNIPKNMRWAYLFQKIDQAVTSRNKLLTGLLLAAILLAFQLINSSWKSAIVSPIDADYPVVMLDFYSQYSPEVAFQLIEAYGPVRRGWYLLSIWTLDLIFPMLYGLALMWFFIHLLKKSFPWLINDLYKLCFIPFLLTIVDLLENVSITTLILSYPNKISILAKSADFFTEFKWILVNIMLLITIIGYIAIFMNKKEVIAYENNQKSE
jgi:hypothetical protein